MSESRIFRMSVGRICPLCLPAPSGSADTLQAGRLEDATLLRKRAQTL